MAEKPTAAFILSLIGAALIILNALILAFFTTLVGVALGVSGRALGVFLPRLGSLVFLLGIGGLVIGVIVLAGAFMINSEDKSRVTTGSLIVLVFSIISFFIGGGFIIGLLLCVVGSILGLTWKPSAPPPPPPSQFY
ncbi:MAG: hypothetical protein FGF53_04765 [Candidatus Brockarchaeota archaeon]|nr:hypothetical protein [Candidatus Brockarchaeota archaeon]MBO3808754.1 hypothetical protein [Candidatus Brockarchaeota archaeon]